MNFFKAAQLGFQLLNALANRELQQKTTYGNGDVALYVGAVELAKQLESRNPGIVQVAGYRQSITETVQ